MIIFLRGCKTVSYIQNSCNSFVIDAMSGMTSVSCIPVVRVVVKSNSGKSKSSPSPQTRKSKSSPKSCKGRTCVDSSPSPSLKYYNSARCHIKPTRSCIILCPIDLPRQFFVSVFLQFSKGEPPFTFALQCLGFLQL